MKTTFKHISLLVLLLMLPMAMWGATYTWSGSRTGDSNEADDKFSGTNTINLSGNVTLTGQIEIESGTTTINLNGYTMTVSGTHRVFCVGTTTTAATLNINGGGTINGGKATRGGCIYIDTKGTVNFKGGIIKNSTSTSGASDDTDMSLGAGGAVHINAGGIFNMSGGTIDNCKTERQTAKDGNNKGFGGAVFMDAGNGYTTTFTMTGGNIKNCVAGAGGAVYMHETTGAILKFTMSGGTIENCKAINDNWSETRSRGTGGGIFVSAQGTFNISGTAKITKCRSTGSGCGVYTEGKVNMSGGEISYNQPNHDTWNGVEAPDKVTGPWASSTIHGGGIAAYTKTASAIVTMSGGTITNNKASSGGGVILWNFQYTDAEVEDGKIKDSKYGPQMTMTGGTISANHALYNGNGGALYNEGGNFDFQGGTMSGNYAIRYGGAINTNQSGKLKFTGTTKVLIDSNEAGHGGGVSQEEGYCEMSISSNNVFITNNRALGQRHENKTLGNGGGIFIEKGILTMDAGLIDNNTCTNHGGGVAMYVHRITSDDKVKFNMSGGKITSNTAGGSGGGIVLHSDTYAVDVITNITGGEIADNKATDGGGLSIEINTTENATANVNVGAIQFARNTATRNGGGIQVRDLDFVTTNLDKITLTLEGTTIEDNSAGTDGGGVHLYTGKMYTQGTDSTYVRRNTATRHGGGIAVVVGEATIRNLSLSHNKAGQDGGGFLLDNEAAPGILNIVINGASVYSNEAYNAAGLAIRDGYMTINYLKACNNIATGGQGGGFGIKTMPSSLALNELSSLQVKNADIFDNTARIGGGFVVNTANVTIENMNVYGNRAAEEGGGFALKTDATAAVDNHVLSNLQIQSANIYENDADKGGGFLVNGAMVTIENTLELHHNTARYEGGGMSINNTSVPYSSAVHINLNHGNVYKNKAHRGGGIAIHDENVLLKDINIYENVADTVGGGLYYRSTTTTTNFQTIDFSDGGNIHHNKAISGAGIFLEGAVKMTVAGKVEQNTARTGGGAYLRWGARMTFTRGVMRNNFAQVSEAEEAANYQIPNKTAYMCIGKWNEPNYVSGIGGGFFLESNAELEFAMEDQKMGVYGNIATHGADDIFANGDGTKVHLPKIAKMSLKEYDVPTQILYWAEDYVSDKDKNGVFMGDKDYYLGTNLKGATGEGGYTNYRYRTALKLLYPDDVCTLYDAETHDRYDEYTNRYLCLALGYQLVFVKIKKESLRIGDDAYIQLYYPKGADPDNGTGGTPTFYRELVLTATKENPTPTKTVVVPEGWWMVKEVPWGSNYTLTGAKLNTENLTITQNSDKSYETERMLIKRVDDVTNTVKDNTITLTNNLASDVHDGSNRKVNYMKPDIPRTAPKKDR